MRYLQAILGLLTLSLMGYSFFQGLFMQACFQFMMGGAIMLLLQRQYELRKPQDHKERHD